MEERAQDAVALAGEVVAGCVESGHSAGCEGDPADVATALVQLSAMVQRLYGRVSERHDLTPVQAKLLCVLLAGPRGMADVAQCLGVEKAALTGLMDRVERRGLAGRSPVPGDRRALQATLTEAGRRAASAFHAEVSAELNRLVSPLTPEDLERTRAMLAAMITASRATFSSPQ
jgi:DNA-binding MarR family transcriptional regulator